jgi:hypothetical protein
MRLDHGNEIRADGSTIRLPTRVVHFEIPCKGRVLLGTPTPYPLSIAILEWTRIRRKPAAAASGTSDMTRL